MSPDWRRLQPRPRHQWAGHSGWHRVYYPGGDIPFRSERRVAHHTCLSSRLDNYHVAGDYQFIDSILKLFLRMSDSPTSIL
jgi:hypothetical protein